MTTYISKSAISLILITLGILFLSISFVLNRSVFWSTTEGLILNVGTVPRTITVGKDDVSNLNQYDLQVTVQYSVNGETHTELKLVTNVNQMRYRNGDVVDVYYDPLTPQIVELEKPKLNLLILIIGPSIALVGIMLMIFDRIQTKPNEQLYTDVNLDKFTRRVFVIWRIILVVTIGIVFVTIYLPQILSAQSR
jgi:hypothetical protein